MSEIRQYIRRNRNGKKRTRVGLLIARRNSEGVPVILWSLCKKVDSFDLNEAVRVAEEGNQPENRLNRPIPRGISEDLNSFSQRAERYFKQAVVA